MKNSSSFIDTYRDKILPLPARAQVRNRWLKQRLDLLMPELMAREGFDLWIVAAREYNEDPVIMTLLPEPAMAARRRTILVFSRNENGDVERLTLDRYGHPDFYTSAWDVDNETQFGCLRRVVTERNPQTIGINVSPTFAFGDGLSHNEHQLLVEALGDELAARTRSGERLCVGWLERRIESELTAYPGIVEIGHTLIAEAYSTRIIHPGITTTDDLVWWFRQKMLDIGLQAWFQPTVEIQAPGESYNQKENKRTVILPGDLLHCDVGFYYLGLATDHQQHAYMLKPGETDTPEGLKSALADGNKLQDILMNTMTVGKTGNQVLAESLAAAQKVGIDPCIYSHPLGYHGHAAGPVIGLWDKQDGVPGTGDYELFDHTCYAIELNVKRNVPEWDGQEVRISLEEDAVLTDGKMRWLAGRQTEFHLIG